MHPLFISCEQQDSGVRPVMDLNHGKKTSKSLMFSRKSTVHPTTNIIFSTPADADDLKQLKQKNDIYPDKCKVSVETCLLTSVSAEVASLCDAYYSEVGFESTVPISEDIEEFDLMYPETSHVDDGGTTSESGKPPRLIVDDYVQEYGVTLSQTSFEGSDYAKTPRTSPLPSFKTVEFGRPGTLQHRIFFRKNGWQGISPWNDVPLYGPDGMLFFVCTTPKGQWVNMEVEPNEKFTPLRVRDINSQPSHYAQNAPLSVGFLPQTVSIVSEDLREGKEPSDEKLPVEVLDLGTNPRRKSGDVYLIKPLVAFLVADRDEQLSWHVIGIDRDDTKAGFVNNLKDIKCFFPSILPEVTSWLQGRLCLESGDEEALIGHEGEPVDIQAVESILEECHSAWELHSEFEYRVAEERPLLSDEFELIWEANAANESDERIELSEPQNDSSLIYDAAWACVMAREESNDEIPSPNSTCSQLSRRNTWRGKSSTQFDETRSNASPAAAEKLSKSSRWKTWKGTTSTSSTMTGTTFTLNKSQVGYRTEGYSHGKKFRNEGKDKNKMKLSELFAGSGKASNFDPSTSPKFYVSTSRS